MGPLYLLNKRAVLMLIVGLALVLFLSNLPRDQVISETLSFPTSTYDTLGSSESLKKSPPIVETTKSLAKVCLYRHNLSEDAWRALDATPIHIVYFVWLPNNGNGRKIVEGQWRTLVESGLLARNNTHLHIAMQTQSEAERAWFNEFFAPPHNYSLEHNNNSFEIFIDGHNYFEFIGVRWLYELACNNSDALMIYLHNKGARYGLGRRPTEALLTTQTITHWRYMLALIAQLGDGFQFYNVAGDNHNWVWYSFFWVRARWYMTSPKPILTSNRFYYEVHTGLKDEHARCLLLSGLAAAVLEQSVHMGNLNVLPYKLGNQCYNLIYCDTWYMYAPETEPKWLSLLMDPLMSNLHQQTSSNYFINSVFNYTNSTYPRQAAYVLKRLKSHPLLKGG